MTKEEIIAEIWSHSQAGNRFPIYDGPIGNLAQLIINQVKDYETFLKGEAFLLVAQLVSDNSNWIKLGKTRVYLAMGHFRIGTKEYYFSPRCNGLYLKGTVPKIEGATEDFVSKVEAAFKKLRYGGPPIKSARLYKENYSGFESIEVIIPSPEGGEDLSRIISYAHKHDHDREGLIKEFVTEMFFRWKHRESFQARIAGVMAWASKILENEEGVSVIGGELSYPRFEDGEIKSATYYAVISMLGENLTPKPVKISLHSDFQLSILMKKHRKFLKTLKETGNAREARTCHPIVAAAIRAQAPIYGKGILEEIETLLAGKYPKDNNPRKRGISSLRMENGELRAIVTLIKDVRFQQERLTVRQIKTLPATMLSAMPGKPVKVIIDHPYVEGLIIKKVSITNEGLVVRIEPKPESLESVIADLRNEIGKTKGQS